MASLSVLRELLFPLCPLSAGLLILEFKNPHGQKLAVAGFWLSGDLPVGATPRCGSGLSPAWPLASTMHLPSVARQPVVPAMGDHWKGGTLVSALLKFTVKLLWFGGHGVGVGDAKARHSPASVPINRLKLHARRECRLRPFSSCSPVQSPAQ